MNEASNPAEHAQNVVDKADANLQVSDSSPFSPPAFSLLKAKIADYVKELVNESSKVSKRHRADTISAAHVERASEYLVTSTSRRFYRHLGTLGGVLMGAALSSILTMTVVGEYTGGGTILSATLGIVGAFMIALHIAKD
jgi:hypothetical protein